MREFTGFLRGVDLGGWLSQCGMNYTEEHYLNFIQEEDIKTIAGWGLDHVRLPIDYNVIQNEDGSFKEEGFKHVERAVQWCEKYGLRIILDIHKAKGYVFDDKNYCSFFTDEPTQDIFIALWQEIARRYGERENIAFELLNEVTMREFAEPWNKIIARTIPAIRQIAPTTRIVVGGIFNNSIFGLTLLEPPTDENIVFTFHCYSPLAFTHQKASWVDRMPSDYDCVFPMPASTMREESLKIFGLDFDSEFDGLGDEMLGAHYFKKMFAGAVAIAEKFNVPLYMGEYGVIENVDPQCTLAWYQAIHEAVDELQIARAAWTYKEMNFGLTDEGIAGIRDELVKLL